MSQLKGQVTFTSLLPNQVLYRCLTNTKISSWCPDGGLFPAESGTSLLHICDLVRFNQRGHYMYFCVILGKIPDAAPTLIYFMYREKCFTPVDLHVKQQLF